MNHTIRGNVQKSIWNVIDGSNSGHTHKRKLHHSIEDSIDSLGVLVIDRKHWCWRRRRFRRGRLWLFCARSRGYGEGFVCEAWEKSPAGLCDREEVWRWLFRNEGGAAIWGFWWVVAGVCRGRRDCFVRRFVCLKNNVGVGWSSPVMEVLFWSLWRWEVCNGGDGGCCWTENAAEGRRWWASLEVRSEWLIRWWRTSGGAVGDGGLWGRRSSFLFLFSFSQRECFLIG